MRILLDTHIYLWWEENNRNLSKKAKSLIESAVEVYVSSASICEIAIKTTIGKFDIDIELLVKALSQSDFIELPITVKHAATLRQLPLIHKDPFDRILLAQAMSEPLKLLTADKTLARYTDLVDVV